MSLLAIEDLTLRIAGRTLLDQASLAVDPGRRIGLLGRNGAGKSTLLRALAGLLPGGTPDPRRIGFLPQGARAAWGLTVAEVAALGRIPHRDAATAPVEAALARCGIAQMRARRVDRLSGGEARRAMLARVFATDPEIFLLDEPTADLDPRAAHEIAALLAATAHAGRIVVAVLHALELALHHADRMVVMQAGRITADAAPDAALPAAAAAFGLPWGTDPTPRLLPPA
jgi:iron complex transport system ATP-binding protein